MTNAIDIGPLDWRIGIVDKGGRPTPEFQRRWNSQRNNNELIGSITTGSGSPANPPVPSDGEVYIDISTTPWTLYGSSGGVWKKVGVYKFTELSDVPTTYAGSSNRILKVNNASTAVEFATISTILDNLGAAQGDLLYRSAAGWTVLTPGTSGQVLTTQGPAVNPIWAPGGGGGGSPKWYMNPNAITSNSNTGPALIYSPVWLEVGDTVSGAAVFLVGAITMNMGVCLYGPGRVVSGLPLLASSAIASVVGAAGATVAINFTSIFTAVTAGLYWVGMYQGSSVSMYTNQTNPGSYQFVTLASFPNPAGTISGSTSLSSTTWAYR